MSEKIEEKGDTKLVGGGGNTTTMSFEALHNLVGLFSILLEVDRRKNPQKYAVKKAQNND